MKNARSYEPKIRKLMTEARKQKVESNEVAVDDPIGLIIEAILADDASADQVRQAMTAVRKEFVDLNELRVCIPSEIVECIGKDLPHAREKAQTIAQVLHGIYGRASAMNVEYMRQYSKRDVRRHLQEIGLSPYAEALVSMTVFDVHAIPVDDALVDALIVTGCVDEETDVADTQPFLERVINQKDNMTAHVFFRKYIRTHWKAIEKKRAEEAERRAAEEAQAKKAAEEAARKAEQAAKEAEEAKARKEEEKAAKAKKQKAKSAKKKAAKKTAKKTAKKKTKKKTSKKKTAKKATKKSRKKAAKKSPKRSSAKKKTKAAKKKKNSGTTKKK